METLAIAQQMAREIGGTVEALLLCSNPDPLAEQLRTVAIHSTTLLTNPAFDNYDPDIYCLALQSYLSEHSPEILLMAHTYQNIDFAPKLAARLQVALATDCIGFRWDDEALILVRPMFRNKLHADVALHSPQPLMATIQGGAADVDDLQQGSGEILVNPYSLDAAIKRRQELETIEIERGKIDLGKADIVVGVGRGIKKAENLPIIQELADALGAEIGASRPVVDNDWLERERQIGSSGQNITPRLYLACGISGAIQHTVGMKGANCIVAINTDANAPIFNVAHYGIVGDLFEIVPELTRLIKEQT
jgi:electron transfer flavoprotein alpha subunit